MAAVGPLSFVVDLEMILESPDTFGVADVTTLSYWSPAPSTVIILTTSFFKGRDEKLLLYGMAIGNFFSFFSLDDCNLYWIAPIYFAFSISGIFLASNNGSSTSSITLKTIPTVDLSLRLELDLRLLPIELFLLLPNPILLF